MAFRAALDKMTAAATTATTGSVYFRNMFSRYLVTAKTGHPLVAGRFPRVRDSDHIAGAIKQMLPAADGQGLPRSVICWPNSGLRVHVPVGRHDLCGAVPANMPPSITSSVPVT